MKLFRISLVVLLAVLLAISFTVSFAAEEIPAILAAGTPVPTPEQPPENEEDIVWTTGCVIETYGNSAPWTHKVWFSYLFGYGYASSSIYYPVGTKVIASVYPGPSPMGITGMLWNGWCGTNGEPIGALDGSKVDGHARILSAPDICPGALDNNSMSTATPLAINVSAYDSFTVALDNDIEDWYELSQARPAYTYRVSVVVPATEAPVWLMVINGSQSYPKYCTPGWICQVLYTAIPGISYAQLTSSPNGDGNYAPPSPFCSKYSIRYSRAS